MTFAARGHGSGTLLGILAILLWGSTIAAIRAVVEQLGALGAGACANLIAGGVACAIVLASPRRRGRLRRLPRAYLFGCGTLFVLYCPPLYLAMHWAATREQAVEVALVNYLWPAMSLALSVVVLNKRARPLLGPALLLALIGVCLGMSNGRGVSWHSFGRNLAANPWPYAMAFAAALLWALYSNLSSRWAADVGENPVPLFLLATGLVLAVLWWAEGITVRHPWTARGVAELLYLSLFPTLLAYVCWDAAMRKGHVVLVNSLSFFIPLISTAISCAYLGVRAGAGLWLACALVVVGAVACRLSIVDRRS